ncbi:MAG: hypothetical protein EOP87_22260, partial [Verrucomicrobiaceae bacterium]
MWVPSDSPIYQLPHSQSIHRHRHKEQAHCGPCRTAIAPHLSSAISLRPPRLRGSFSIPQPRAFPPITDHRSPISDHRSPITDHRSPITDH